MMLKEVDNSINILEEGGVILYPTDTVWGLGCDATNEVAVNKIYETKKRNESKSLVVLVDSIEMLEKYIVNIPLKALELLKNAPKPTTIIYDNPKGLATNVLAHDNTVAIRIAKDEFCQKMIRKFGKPVVSTSANISEKPTPISFDQIEDVILNTVDYIVNLYQDKTMAIPSRIVKILKGGALEIIRE